jgi:hypothetical protein
LPSINPYTNINPSPKSPVQDFHAKPPGASSSQSSPAKGSEGILNLRKFDFFL